MKITVSESNQIVQFIRRWRRFLDTDGAPFPDDICSLTRVFIGYLIIVCMLGGAAGFLLFIMYWTVLVYTFGPTEGGDIFIAVIGTLLWGLVGFVAIAYSRMKLIEGGYIDPMPKRTGPSLRERVATSSEWRLLREIFRSVKDKTCILVEIKSDQGERR